MDETTKLLAEMGINLTTLAVKGTTSAIHNKIKAIKENNKLDSVRSAYDEIINELLSEREEAIRIAQAYKEELERVQISEEDIQYLHETINRLLELLKKYSPDPRALDTFQQAKELISVDTLKTMQLLGFNYKEAIGEPLTKLCASAIMSLGKTASKKR